MTTAKRIVSTGEAPQAIGPYSQAVVAGGLVFTSGQVPIDPATGRRPRPDIGEIIFRENSANSSYHSLQLSLNKKSSC